LQQKTSSRSRIHYRGRQSTSKDPYAAALRLLSQRSFSVEGLLDTLRRKFPGNKNLSGVIERLQKLDFLDDRRFAENRASFLAQNRGWGPLRIRRELKVGKVPEKWIALAVGRAFQNTNERELVGKFLAKKLDGISFPLTPQKFASLSRSLVRRGFSTDVIMDSIRSYRRGGFFTEQDVLTEVWDEE